MTITFKKLINEKEIALFWEKKREYERNDIFPNLTETGQERAEIVEWFHSEEYYRIIMNLHHHPKNGDSPLEFIFVYDQDTYIGFLTYKIYHSEDGKAFILDFSIETSHRNQGLGSRVVAELELFLKEQGAAYLALNTSNENNTRFWLRNGFSPTEPDEYGNIVYTKEI